MTYKVYFATKRGSPTERVNDLLGGYGWQGVLAHEGDTDVLAESFPPHRLVTPIMHLSRIWRECKERYGARGGVSLGDVVDLGGAFYLYTGVGGDAGWEVITRPSQIKNIEDGIKLGWA